MVNWEFFDNQTPESATRLVDDLRAGAPSSPTRGAPLCTFKETARILAGFPDERPGAVEAAAARAPPPWSGCGSPANGAWPRPRRSTAPQRSPATSRRRTAGHRRARTGSGAEG